MNTLELVLMCISAAAVLALAGFLGALKALFRERSRSAELDRKLAATEERAKQLEAGREEANAVVRAQAAE